MPRFILKLWFLISTFSMLACLSLSGCASLRSCKDDPQCLRVLFIGNSYTFTNDLPKTFSQLAESGGQRVETGVAAEGGWTLAQHAASANTLKLIQSEKWNYVVLQEQSQIPASLSARETGMFPAARTLVDNIRNNGATPVLFITWAHRNGWPENGAPGYESMQKLINGSYLTIGQELKAQISPVGYAWLSVFRQSPQMNLWQEDGSHPNEQGTYLAACVFYATVFGKSPEGLGFTGNVKSEDAALLQKIAWDTVSGNLKKWNLP